MISYLEKIKRATTHLQKLWRSKFSKKLRIRIPPYREDYELESGERAPKASLKIY